MGEALHSVGVDGPITTLSLSLPEDRPEPVLLGFAVLQAWHFVLASPAGVQSKSMCDCLRIENGKGRVGFLEHPVLVGGALNLPLVLPHSWQYRTAAELGAELAQAAATADISMYADDGSGRIVGIASGMDGLLQRWAHLLVDGSECYPWPLWTPLGRMIVRRQWSMDVSIVTKRVYTPRWQPPVMPCRSLLLKFVRRDHDEPAHDNKDLAIASIETPMVVTKQRNGAGAVPFWYDSRHLVAALRAAANSSSVKKALTPGNISAMCKFLWPKKKTSETETVLAELLRAGFHIPSRESLRKARVRLDVTSMLVRRLVSHRQPMFRYIFFGASPQRNGREVFCSCERTVPCSAVSNTTFSAMPSTALKPIHRLPICALAQGNFSMADKVACLIHQTCWNTAPQPKMSVLQIAQCGRVSVIWVPSLVLLTSPTLSRSCSREHWQHQWSIGQTSCFHWH